MATRRIQNRPKAALQAEQKIAFALLVFLGFGGILFGFRSFGSQLYRPIQLQMAKYYTGQDVVSADAPDAKAVEESKKKDTDADGLFDYDELYVYRTSPYLKDSDSDGTEDKSEVFAGTDPNCPVGKNCNGSVTGQTEQSVGTGSDVTGLIGTTGSDAEAILKSGNIKFETKEDVEKYFKAATIIEIRSALIQAGASKENVDKMTDAELQIFYDEAVANAAAAGSLDAMVTVKP